MSYSEISKRRKIRRNVLAAKCPYGEMSHGEVSHGEKSHGGISGHPYFKDIDNVTTQLVF